MRAQTFERHPLDRHVLLSQNIEDITRLHPAIPDHFKAGIFRGLIDDEIKNDLLSIPRDAKYLTRKMRPFFRAEDANDLLKKDLTFRTLELLAKINIHFSNAANGQATSLCFVRNLGIELPSSQSLHYEGGNPSGPSMRRDFRANLSVSSDDRSQMQWVPMDRLSDTDLQMIVNRSQKQKPPYVTESVASGDLSVLHGLSYDFPDLRKHGLLHSGPQRHDRISILWGIIHPA